MGILSKLRSRRPIDLDQRAPQTGLKLKDMLVLEQLVKAGADVNEPRHVIYYLYFHAEGHALGAQADAQAAGFETQVRPPDPDLSPQWALVCERYDHVLTIDAVRDNTDMFEAIAARHGGDYDGWEASVV